MHKTFFALIVSLSLCLTGCFYNMHTNSYADAYAIPCGFAEQTSFAVIEPQSEHPLMDKEIRRKIEKFVTAKGYRIASPQCAQYHLYFGYGLKRDQKINLGAVWTDVADILLNGRDGFGLGCLGFDLQPQEENTHWIQVRAYDQHSHLVWESHTMTVDEESDLREMLNYLLISNLHNLGKTTGKQVTHTMIQGNKTVKWLKAGA